jgi:hypothetical protein
MFSFSSLICLHLPWFPRPFPALFYVSHDPQHIADASGLCGGFDFVYVLAQCHDVRVEFALGHGHDLQATEFVFQAGNHAAGGMQLVLDDFWVGGHSPSSVKSSFTF